MNIEALLTKYFEGETSAAEEQQLRTFFASGNVPPEWEVYRPLFAYFDEEIAKTGEQKVAQPPVRRIRPTGRVLYILFSMAASVLLLLGLNYWFNPTSPRFCSGNYVVINGRCYTDIHTIRERAFDALHEVATPASEYMLQTDDMDDNEIMKNQLKELGALFSEDE